jgi:hypothetical protein
MPVEKVEKSAVIVEEAEPQTSVTSEEAAVGELVTTPEATVEMEDSTQEKHLNLLYINFNGTDTVVAFVDEGQ